MPHPFSRTELLIGTEALDKLKNSTVIIFGIGGVGTFVAEGLARSGVGNFVLVDDDTICQTNINRQIHATQKTLGRPKVDVMRERILEINPDAQVVSKQVFYTLETAESMLSMSYDYIVDAVDSISAKLDLATRAYNMGIPIISCMGAGNKMDPTRFEIADIYKTKICPLARIIRHELRSRGIPQLKVVYSKEVALTPLVIDDAKGKCNCTCPPSTERVRSTRRVTPGSIAFVPSVAGLIIASEVVKDLIGYVPQEQL